VQKIDIMNNISLT